MMNPPRQVLEDIVEERLRKARSDQTRRFKVLLDEARKITAENGDLEGQVHDLERLMVSLLEALS